MIIFEQARFFYVSIFFCSVYCLQQQTFIFSFICRFYCMFNSPDCSVPGSAIVDPSGIFLYILLYLCHIEYKNYLQKNDKRFFLFVACHCKQYHYVRLMLIYQPIRSLILSVCPSSKEYWSCWTSMALRQVVALMCLSPRRRWLFHRNPQPRIPDDRKPELKILCPPPRNPFCRLLRPFRPR